MQLTLCLVIVFAAASEACHHPWCENRPHWPYRRNWYPRDRDSNIGVHSRFMDQESTPESQTKYRICVHGICLSEDDLPYYDESDANNPDKIKFCINNLCYTNYPLKENVENAERRGLVTKGGKFPLWFNFGRAWNSGGSDWSLKRRKKPRW